MIDRVQTVPSPLQEHKTQIISGHKPPSPWLFPLAGRSDIPTAFTLLFGIDKNINTILHPSSKTIPLEKLKMGTHQTIVISLSILPSRYPLFCIFEQGS